MNAPNFEEFENLNPDEQIRVFLKTPLKQKGELILHSHEPGRLARGLSSEELYLITREMDAEERGEVIRYASQDQLLFIADIDCWEKDNIHPEGYLRWLETLLGAGEQKFMAWFLGTDPEAVVAGFKKFIEVVKPVWEYAVDEMLGDRPYFTLDQLYYVLGDESNLEIVKRALEIIYENHKGRYAALLESVIGEMDYEVEEEAYRRREMRLSERGFPDLETARRIYLPLSREQFDAFPLKTKTKDRQGLRPDSKLSSYPVLWDGDRLFLDDVLTVIRQRYPEKIDEIHEEIVWISNKVIVCHGMDFHSEEKVRVGVNRGRALLNLSLEMLSARDLDQAAHLMTTRWLEVIFRRGMLEIAGLREFAQEMVRSYWNRDREKFLHFLDPPFEFICRGCFEYPPLCYDEAVTDQLYPLRDFRTLQDLERCRKSLDQVAAIHRFLNEKIPAILPAQARGRERHKEAPTLFMVLGTLFAHFTGTGRLLYQGLSQEEFKRFIWEAFEMQGEIRVLKPAIKEQFLDRFFSGTDRELLVSFWGVVFQHMQEQTARLKLDQGVPARYLNCLYLRPEKEKKDGSTFRRRKKEENG